MTSTKTIRNDFTNEEKLACLTVLHLLIESSEPRFKNTRKGVLIHNAKLFGVYDFMLEEYIENVTSESLKKDLSLSNTKVEYLIAMTYEMLNSAGFTKNDIVNAENLFLRAVGVTPDELHASLERVRIFTKKFNERTHASQVHPSNNAVSRTYQRMAIQAQDPNQNSFSLNNIVFIIFTALAILGLVSLCS